MFAGGNWDINVLRFGNWMIGGGGDLDYQAGLENLHMYNCLCKRA
jgi:hypothetical protein